MDCVHAGLVWFQAPDVRLPTFFQRLVGIADALLSMLVVMFAVREYGKRFHRVPLPLLGRVSTSRVAGGLVFLAVLGWWMSPWALIPAGQPEPDLWRLLEDGLDTPLVQVVDTNLATLLPPAPSADARQVAEAFTARLSPSRGKDPLRSALVEIALGKFDDAETLLKSVPIGSPADLADQARAQLDLYRADFAAAALRYGEMLKAQPRREDFLAHGAMAAAIAGDYSTAAGWAQQLLEQARARGRLSARAVEATNLLAVVHLLSGDYAEARRTGDVLLAGGDGERKLLPRDASDSAGPQTAAAANNAAVIRLLAGSEKSDNPSPSSGFAQAQELWLNRRAADGRSPQPPGPQVAVERTNLGMTALQETRYDQADALLTESQSAWRKFTNPPARVGLAINLNAIAQLDCTAGRYARGESQAHEAADLFSTANADDPSVFANRATIAMLDTDQGRYDQAIRALQPVIQEAELGHRGLMPRHPYVAILKLRLAESFLRASRNAEAQTAAEQALTILDRAGLNASRSAADALRISGLAALRQGNREMSERQLDRAQELLHAANENHPAQSPAVSPESSAVLAAQGELAADLQNYSDAADDYHAALDQLSQLFDKQSADHPLRAEYLHALAMLLVHEEKPSEAKPLLEESLAIDRRFLIPDHPSTLSVMEDLATVLENRREASRRKASHPIEATSSPTADPALNPG